VDFKLELMVLPVSDIDQAKAFYAEKAGFHLDIDVEIPGVGRVVQLTPPGSACSVGFGTAFTQASPGSIQSLYLVVTNIEAARQELIDRGLDVAQVRHMVSGEWLPGPDPDHRDYASYAEFKDPDGNLWLLQEVRRGHPSR
jgi:catechol 2,3-dioxygenase-like lactoylglutathione lyase family enzyme